MPDTQKAGGMAPAGFCELSGFWAAAASLVEIWLDLVGIGRSYGGFQSAARLVTVEVD